MLDVAHEVVDMIRCLVICGLAEDAESAGEGEPRTMAFFSKWKEGFVRTKGCR